MLGAAAAALAGTLSLAAPASGAQAPRPAPGPSLEKVSAAACDEGYLCLYDGFNFTGSMYMAFRCGVIYNVGRDWGSDKTRSYNNNQTGRVTAVFYNWDGANWQPIGQSRAKEAKAEAPAVFYSSPGGVDGVKPC